MAKIKWNRNKVLPSAINSGSEFTTDDDLSVQELNAMVNNSFYGVDFVEGMTENPVVEESDPSATPSVELVDYTKVIDSTERTFKKFKFNNIKGQQGIKGDKGEKGETGIGFDTITNETLNTEVVDYNIDTGANIQMTNFITFNDGTNKSINTEINLNIKGANGINIDANETNDALVISSEGSSINLLELEDNEYEFSYTKETYQAPYNTSNSSGYSDLISKGIIILPASVYEKIKNKYIVFEFNAISSNTGYHFQLNGLLPDISKYDYYFKGEKVYPFLQGYMQEQTTNNRITPLTIIVKPKYTSGVLISIRFYMFGFGHLPDVDSDSPLTKDTGLYAVKPRIYY